MLGHLGHQWLTGSRPYECTEYRLGVTKDIGAGFTLSATLNGTDC